MKSSKDLNNAIKRVFFALEVEAPWPERLPSGRILKEENRHMTVAFLGNVDFLHLQQHIASLPLPPFPTAPCGICDKFLFLPKKHPRVVAGNIRWLSQVSFDGYLSQLNAWLSAYDYPVEARAFLPHVTMARSPFNQEEWEKMFSPFPILAKGLHLYATVECLEYQPLWSYPFPLPFEEIEHTADIAFRVQAATMQELFLHAQMALAFKFPPLLAYFREVTEAEDLDTLIMGLNQVIARADCEIGCPFKAISFHGTVSEHNTLLQWEMIVDV